MTTRNPYFVENVTILMVERSGEVNRYGQPQMNVVENRIRGNLDMSTKYRRTSQGDEIQIDGSIMIGEDVTLQAKDRLTIDTPTKDKYEVFSVGEVQDPATGIVLFRTYDLTRQRR